MVKHPGPTDAQIEAARKLREKTPAPVVSKPAAPKITAAVEVDPDPHPTPPTWSGKDEDFPAWVQADIRYKEAYSAWMVRRRKS